MKLPSRIWILFRPQKLFYCKVCCSKLHHTCCGTRQTNISVWTELTVVWMPFTASTILYYGDCAEVFLDQSSEYDLELCVILTSVEQLIVMYDIVIDSKHIWWRRIWTCDVTQSIAGVFTDLDINLSEWNEVTYQNRSENSLRFQRNNLKRILWQSYELHLEGIQEHEVMSWRNHYA